ncbi:serine/threonine-protein kinase [Streptomyces griseoflavus]|uniref:serine/threonine-protein kinase n=1 Tax=Streptomyces griseoflavus TaxID=35619 RepID=UPI0033A95A7E
MTGEGWRHAAARCGRTHGRGSLPAARPARLRRHGARLPGPQRRWPHRRGEDRAPALRAGRGVPGPPPRSTALARGDPHRREVDAARRVGGAWTASVLDADPEARVPWVATAYAAGPSLAAAVTDAGPLPAHSVRTLGAGLAEALAAVHELGLVHRDVKPSNVLLTLDGPLLIDFGITRAMDGTASLTSTGVSIGSPGYMSPEQILGKGVTGAADVFSLGAVLAYAATGRPPFPGDSSAALLYKVVHEPPELGGLDGALRDVTEACLNKDPSARPVPAEVARRLAPEGGAARLVAGGWLPGPLVEQVSRAAVRLLNLEAEGEGPASGPLGFSRPSVSGSPGAGVTGPASGVFGPPPVMPEREEPGGAVLPEPRDAPDGPAGGTDANPYATARPAARPAGEGEGPDGHRPGKLSVSVAATASPGAGGRGRRVSCTVALAVAGALAAVTVTTVVVQDWLPGRSPSGSADAEGSAGPQAPAVTVPAGHLGTWEGQATSRDTVSLPLGTFRVTLHQATVGEKVGTLRHTDIFGGTCDDVLTLKQVTGKRLVTTSVGAKDNRGVCDQESHTVLLTRVGDDLVYESDSKPSGRPEARLSKIG